MVEVLEQMKKPSEEIEATVDAAKSNNLYSISNVFKGLIFNYLVPLSIIGLLLSAALQKNNPNQA
jgi:NADH:ubiquinone oxidoreductase subunit 6 (subunit J)